MKKTSVMKNAQNHEETVQNCRSEKKGNNEHVNFVRTRLTISAQVLLVPRNVKDVPTVNFGTCDDRPEKIVDGPLYDQSVLHPINTHFL